jgi:hypothetical protein
MYVPPYRLSFLLPTSLAGFVRSGTWQPCLAGCLLTVDRSALVRISGRSREAVLDQAARFLRVVAKTHPPLVIAATLISPCGARDSWTITVNAGVSFAPTGLGADVSKTDMNRNVRADPTAADQQR